MEHHNQTISPGFTRRRFLQLGLGAAILPGLGALSGCGPSQPLKVAVQPWCGYQFLFVGREEGWLDTKQVELVETALTTESVAALREGRVDAAALTLDEVLLLRAKGHPLHVVMVFDASAGADVLLARPGIAGLPDLKGKRIGMENSGLGVIMLHKVLQAAGLQPQEVEVVKMGEDHAQAWSTAQLDAILTYEPHLGTLLKQGLQPLFDSRQTPNLILGVLAVTPQAVSDKAEALHNLVHSHFRARYLWQTHPAEAAYQLAPRLGVPAQEVGQVFKGLDLPDVLSNRHYLTAPAEHLAQSANEIAAILSQAGMMPQRPDLAGLFTADFLPDHTEREHDENVAHS